MKIVTIAETTPTRLGRSGQAGESRRRPTMLISTPVADIKSVSDRVGKEYTPIL